MFMTTRPIPGTDIYQRTARDFVRVAGTFEAAWIETCSDLESSTLSSTPDEWVPQVVGTVELDGTDVVIHAPTVEERSQRALAGAWAGTLRDHGYLVEERVRYRTHRYVALDAAEAARLAAIDKTPADQVERTEGVEVAHHGGSWALWTDGRLTTATGLPGFTKERKSLHPSVATVVTAMRGSDSPISRPILDRVLAAGEIREVTIDRRGGAGYYAGPGLLRLDLELGEPLYVFTQGYFEGYAYHVAESLDDLSVYLGD